ncbi:MAG: hypothetical protein R2911_14535 [Caldilineaceae bacterium]
MTVDGRQSAPVTVMGRACYFQVTVAATDYRLPHGHAAPSDRLPRRLCGLSRRLSPVASFHHSGPPKMRPTSACVNRVNQHTLDMRTDRTPTPIRHHHGPVAGVASLSIIPKLPLCCRARSTVCPRWTAPMKATCASTTGPPPTPATPP